MATLSVDEKSKEHTAGPSTIVQHETKEKSNASGLFKKHSTNPSPLRNRKSTITSREELTDSVTSIPERSEKDERKHSFLNLFTRKHPPTSLENLTGKSGARRRDSSTGTPISLDFLHRLSFHTSSHSPSTPQSNSLAQMEEGTLSRPVDHLFPLKEMDALEENANRLPTQPDQLWSEPATNTSVEMDEPPVEIHVSEPPSSHNQSPQRRALDEALHEREQVQQALEKCLEDFREGKMRSLANDQVIQLRKMHENQLSLTLLHQEILRMDDPLMEDPQIDYCFAKIADKLTELHKQMDEFSEVTVG
ncbi:hypothetical protein M3Y98_00652900 [Aphelenchoides besseyi]|nr:hypothetical protein M3Y98_00652900 [Aphelenchoides besseyi]KAI6208697.1 hypothetical protein M3Y96_00142300 [Aphelenchoides besseyi]